MSLKRPNDEELVSRKNVDRIRHLLAKRLALLSGFETACSIYWNFRRALSNVVLARQQMKEVLYFIFAEQYDDTVDKGLVEKISRAREVADGLLSRMRRTESKIDEISELEGLAKFPTEVPLAKDYHEERDFRDYRIPDGKI